MVKLKQPVLRPVDLLVALRIAGKPEITYAELHEDLGVSTSTAHEAVERLRLSGLLQPHQRKVNRLALLEFLEHGVRYAFPAIQSGARVRGVPTAHASPLFEPVFAAGAKRVVWPSRHGNAEGEALSPLYDKAPELAQRCPEVYENLTLVDALRIGRARERKVAARILRERLGLGAEPDA